MLSERRLSWSSSSLLIAGVAIVIALAVASAALAAASYTVNTTADNLPSGSECTGAAGDCSLRQALDKAVSGDTVVVPASASPYVVVNEKIPVLGGVTINGGGASSTTISGNGAEQIFNLIGSGPVTIRALTLTDAHNDSGLNEGGAINATTTTSDLTLDGVTISNSDSPQGFGGAIRIGSNVTIEHSRFTHDSATSGGGGAIDLYGNAGSITISESVFDSDSETTTGNGGALLIEGTSPFSPFSITSSTFSNDSTNGHPGGAVAIESGTGTISNSTFTGNTASAGGALVSSGTIQLLSDTFAANTAATGASLQVASGSVMPRSTIFAGPIGGPNCAGTITSGGFNLEDTKPSSCGFVNGVNGDVVGQDPHLAGTLADNSSQVPTPGGPPQTLAIPATSPAVGAVTNVGLCTTVRSVDERGFPRPGIAGVPGCDIGAFEVLPAVQTTTSVVASSAATTVGAPLTFTATVTPGRSLPGAVPGMSGAIVFHDGPATLATVAVGAGGHATLSVSSLPVGAHSITATYGGDAIYTGSPSGPVNVTVVPPPSPASASPPAPTISGVSQSHKIWREGNKLATASRKKKPPVGTTFAFALNRAANVSLVFTQTLPGRRVGKKCVAQTNHNKHKRACTRAVNGGTLSFSNLAAGHRRIAFQGRLTSHKKLRPGNYILVITAINATGHTSSIPIRFTIVKG